MNDKKVAVNVVTYNRLEYLKEIINSLRIQSKKLDTILVINNSSTDGTKEWLENQPDLKVIEQENSGSSGGQYTGIKTLYEEGFDWIWTMDDDVVPEKDCLEKLMEIANEKIIRVPLRYTPSGKPFFNDVISYNLTNPFKKFWKQILSEDYLKDKYIDVEGITFEGPLFHRTVVDKFGLPEKNFFIYGDDTDYFLRYKKSDFKLVLCRDARLNRKLEAPDYKDVLPWKKYYTTRNQTAIVVKHGNLAVRLLSPLKILLMELLHLNRFADLKYIFKGFFNGYFYKSDNP